MTDLEEFGNTILAYNKPIFEVTLTRKERTCEDFQGTYLSTIMYNRICAKNKTIVISTAEKDKKFSTTLIITGDLDFPPKNVKAQNNPLLESIMKNYDGIYVGANISVIERFAGISVQNISRIQKLKDGFIKPEYIEYYLGRTYIAYKNGTITELGHIHGEGDTEKENMKVFHRKHGILLGRRLKN